MLDCNSIFINKYKVIYLTVRFKLQFILTFVMLNFSNFDKFYGKKHRVFCIKLIS